VIPATAIENFEFVHAARNIKDMGRHENTKARRTILYI